MTRVITGPTVAPHSGPAGTLLRRVGLPAAVLTSTAYAPRLRLPPHAHTSAFVLFVRDVGAAWIDRLRDAGFNGERFSVRSPFVQQFGDRLDAELAEPDGMSEMIVEALATEVIVLGARCGKRCRGPWAERARRLIEHDFASPLSLGGIAAAVGVHPVHLARQFRASHGCTVGEYIRHVRVAFARQQLTTSDRAIAEIALAAGFSDQSQLTKSFKRVTGQTPAAYRTRLR